MKIWTDQELKDRDGNPLWELPPVEGRPARGDSIPAIEAKAGVAWTLGSIIERVCNNEHPEDKALSFKKKTERFLLAARCYKPKEQPVQIETSDAELIKELVGRAFSPLVCGQVHLMIENGAEKKSD